MTAPDTSNLANFMPGFDFFQHFARQAAGSAGPGAQSGVPGMPPMGHWVAPTFDVEEIDKRIQDLRAVHFWLDQNTKMLAATIQALEVQKMTLATLKSMNVSMQDMATAFRMRPQQTEPAPLEPDVEKAPQTAGVDPMQWWAALTQQFQAIAAETVRDMADRASKTTEQATPSVRAASAAVAGAQQPVAAAVPSRRGGAKKSASQATDAASAPVRPR